MSVLYTYGDKSLRYRSTFRIKFYETERKLFPEAFNQPVASDDVGFFVKKLESYYGLRPFTIYFINGHTAYSHSGRFLEFPKSGSSVGVICHEVAHYHVAIKEQHTSKMRHDKKLMDGVRAMTDYCKANDY